MTIFSLRIDSQQITVVASARAEMHRFGSNRLSYAAIVSVERLWFRTHGASGKVQRLTEPERSDRCRRGCSTQYSCGPIRDKPTQHRSPRLQSVSQIAVLRMRALAS